MAVLTSGAARHHGAPLMDPHPSFIQTKRAAIARRCQRWPANLRGVLLVSTGAFVMVCMAGLVKHLAVRLPVFEILFVRCLAGFLFILPVVARRGMDIVRTRRPGMHFNRGFVGTMGNACLFYSVAHMAMAEAVTIQFSRPLFMILIAAIFLGDAAGWGRGLATAVGFIGIVIFGEVPGPWSIAGAAIILASSLYILRSGGKGRGGG